MSQNRGRDSFCLLATCAAAAVLLAAVSGCQESTAPAASRTSFASGQTASGGNPDSASASSAGAASKSQAIRDISFDNVKLKMKLGDKYQRSLITPAIEKLDGSRIRIRGYILPPLQQSGLPRFILVRDNQACCFGPNAAVFDSMIVDMQPGQTTDYSLSPITVEGTFNIREIDGGSGNPISIYHVTAEAVK